MKNKLTKLLRCQKQTLVFVLNYLILAFFFSIPVFAETTTYDFSSSGDFTADSAIQVDDSDDNLAKLPALDQTDDDNDVTGGFQAGTHTGTQWDTDHLEHDGTGGIQFPNGSVSTGWFDMSNNQLLMHFDEAAAASSFADDSTNENDASCANCPDSDQDGKVGKAIDFNGSNDVIEIDDSASNFLQTTDKLTISAWVLFEGTSGNTGYTILHRGDGWSTQNYSLKIWYGGSISYMNDNIQFSWRDSGSSSQCYAHTDADSYTKTGEWQHIAVTADWGTGGDITIYIDGVAQNTTLSGCTIEDTPYTAGGGTVYVGKAATAYYFNGLMDEVAVFTDDLTASEISQIYDTQNLGAFGGIFDSRIMDAGASASWTSLSWTPDAPYKKPLADGSSDESANYATDGIDMSSNILLFHMDESSGDLSDTSASGLTGSAAGFDYGSEGKFNDAITFSFDGDDSLVVSDTATLEPTEEITVSVWLKPASAQHHKNGVIINKSDWGSNSTSLSGGYALIYDAFFTYPKFCIYNGASNCVTASGASLTQDEWWHVVGTYDGSTLKIYINGVEEDTMDTSGAITHGAYDLRIGSGAGTQRYRGEMDEVAIFSSGFDAAQVSALYNRDTAPQVKFQVRTCDDDACAGEEFIGPDGTSATFYSEEDSTSASLPSKTLTNLGDNRYFQYRAFIASDETGNSPEIASVTIGPDRYDSTAPVVENNTGQAFTSLSGFSHTLGGNNEGTVEYQISNNGSNWYYWDGGNWTEQSGGGYSSETSSESDVDTNISQFTTDVGSGDFYFRAFLASDGTEQVELDEVSLTYSSIGSLSSDNVEPASLSAGSTNTVTVSFTTENAVPDDGKIKVTFGSGFDLTGVGGSDAICSTMDGSFSTSVDGQTVTITRSGGSSEAAAAENCTIANVVNPTVSGSTGVYGLETSQSDDTTIDENTNVTADTITANQLTSTNVEPQSLMISANSTATVTFTTANAIPSDGKITVTFGAGFDLSSVGGGDATCSTMDGSFSASVGGQTVTITRSGGSSEAAAAESCTIANVVNSGSTGSTGTYTIQTTDSSDNAIDEDTSVTADTIGQPSVTIAVDNASIAETSGSSILTATLSEASGENTTINLAFSGTATLTDDYTRSATSIVINAGDTTGTITLNAAGDALDEADETIIVDVDSVTNGTESGTQQQTVTITDDDDAPSVTISVNNASISETGGSSTLTATLSAQSSKDVTINLAFSGTATNTTDYTRSATSIVISAGDTTGTITLNAVGDALDEDNETIIIDVDSVTNGTESGTQQETITVGDDDDPPSVTIAVDNASISETGGSSTLTATLSAQSSKDVTINLAFSGTATNTTDYTRSATSIVISAGDTTGTVTVNTVSDTLDEDNETIIIDVDSVTNGTESGTQQETITVGDDDDPPSVTLNADTTNLDEDGSVSTLTATLSAASGKNVTVTLSFSGSATLTDDYTRSAVSISVSAGDTTGQITLTSVEDDLAEDNETIIVDVDSVTNASESGTQQVTVTIANDDTPGVTVSSATNSASVTEGSNTPSTYTLVLTSEPLSAVTISISANDECEIDESSLIFSTVNWDQVQTLTVISSDDEIDDGNQNCTITHTATSDDSDYEAIEISDQTISVVDDDSAGVSVTQSGGTTAISEDGDQDTYTVVLTSEPLDNVDITITTDAECSSDLDTLTFTASDWNTAQTVTISAVDDDKAESSHTCSITHAATSSGDSGYDEISISSITATVSDDDSAGITITQSGGSTSVVGGTTDDTLSIVMNSQPTANVVVTLSTGDDLEISPSTLTFTANNWETAQTVTLSADEDGSATSATISFASASSDTNYHQLSLSSVSVSISYPEPEEETEEEEDEESEDNNTLAANAGLDRSVASSGTITLDGTGSTGQGLSYAWTLDGEGSLANPTSSSPTYTAPQTTTAIQVTITLIVTDSNGQRATDTMTIRVIGQRLSSRKLGSQDQKPVGRLKNDRLVLEGQKNNRTTLSIGDASLILPAGCEDYTLASNDDGYIGIGCPQYGDGGRVFLFTIPIISNSIQYDLSKDKPAIYTTLRARRAGERLGESIELTDANGDGNDEFFVSSPGAGLAGIVNIYNLDAIEVGSIYGSQDYAVGSIKVNGSIVSGSQSVATIGPANPALNNTLVANPVLDETDMSEMIYFILSDDGFSGTIDMNQSDAAITIGADDEINYQAYDYGDLNGDGNLDMALSGDDGQIYIFFGPLTDQTHLNNTDADVVIRSGSTNTRFGQMLTIGDVTDDDLVDIVIGAPGYGSNQEGAIFVVFGKTEWESEITLSTNQDLNIGFKASIVDLDGEDENIQILGENAQDQIGSDFLLDENYIYTITASGEIYVLSLIGDVGELANQRLTGGSGCSLLVSVPHSLPYLSLVLFISFLILLSLIRLKQNNE